MQSLMLFRSIFSTPGYWLIAAYIAGTFDTKGRELFFLRNCLDKLGLRTVTVDLATSGKPSPAMIHPREVARHHPKGERAVFTGDRGSAVSEMVLRYLNRLSDLLFVMARAEADGPEEPSRDR